MTQARPDVLALDLGKVTGFAARTGDRVASGSWELYLPSRYETLAEGMHSLELKLRTLQPKRIVVEIVRGVMKNNRATEVQHRLHGVVMAYTHTAKIPLKAFAPKEMKRIVAGNGNASKDKVRSVVAFHFPRQAIKDHNHADALGLLLADQMTQQKEIKECNAMFD